MTTPRFRALDVSPELHALLAFLDECATLSTLLTLFVLPTVYSLFRRGSAAQGREV